jgi:methionyl-tRNA formyltransferase
MNNTMRIVFMGTPEIAKTCLQKICEGGYNVVGVYTKPDTPKIRGMKMTMSPVKEYALTRQIPVFQPATFKDESVVEDLRALAPDLVVVVAYGKLLPKAVLDMPPHG